MKNYIKYFNFCVKQKENERFFLLFVDFEGLFSHMLTKDAEIQIIGLEQVKHNPFSAVLQ